MYPAFSNGRICLSYRSAKSVLWISENVVGVKSCRFFPFRVALRTMAEEFHSVKNTLYPSSSSQRLSKYTWVDLPEPSSPSTATSFPAIDDLSGVSVINLRGPPRRHSRRIHFRIDRACSRAPIFPATCLPYP